MMKYRLTYSGPSGSDYLGFDTEQEALLWAVHQERLELIKALKLLKYDSAADRYIEVADFSKMPIDVPLPNAGKNKQYALTYTHNSIYNSILVEAPSSKTAERYLLCKKREVRISGAREATAGDIKPGIPVLTLTEREEKQLRDDLLASDIADLDFSVRTYNSLRRHGIDIVRELVCKSKEELQEMSGLGWKCLEEITSVLEAHGESLAPSPEMEQSASLKVFDYYKLNDESEIYTVALEPGILVDVKVCTDTGLIYVMQNHDGTTVYSETDPERTFPDYKYDEKAVIQYIKDQCPKLSLNEILAAAEAKITAAGHPPSGEKKRPCELSI